MPFKDLKKKETDKKRTKSGFLLKSFEVDRSNKNDKLVNSKPVAKSLDQDKTYGKTWGSLAGVTTMPRVDKNETYCLVGEVVFCSANEVLMKCWCLLR